MVNANMIQILYLVSAALFILGMKNLTKVKSARKGNTLFAGAMLLAVVATVLELGLVDYHELRAARAFEAGHASGEPIKVIYHSHCDAGAYFSKEDAATFAAEGQLMWPCAFIVVSVLEGKLGETKLWVHTPGTDDFEESTLEVR